MLIVEMPPMVIALNLHNIFRDMSIFLSYEQLRVNDGMFQIFS